MKQIAAVVTILCCGSFLYGMEPNELNVVINTYSVEIKDASYYDNILKQIEQESELS